MKIWRERFGRWNFDKKMSFLLSNMLVWTSLLVLLVSSVSIATSMLRQSQKIITDQLEVLAANYDNLLEGYKTLSYAVIMDEGVQDYLECRDKSSPKFPKAAQDTVNTLQNVINMQENSMNFIAIRNTGLNDYLYKGRTSVVFSSFEKAMEQDYAESMPAGIGQMRLSFGNNYHGGNTYSMTIYHPLYSTKHMIRDCGILVMNMEDVFLEGLMRKSESNTKSDTFLMNTDGRIVTIADQNGVGSQVSYRDKIQGTSGRFIDEATQVTYQKIGNWNFYLVNTVSMRALYRNGIKVILSLMLLIFVMTMLCIMAARKLIVKSYQPMERVVSKMDCVKKGDLDVRITDENIGDDFRKLTDGFNTMMDDIMVLMEQVRLEQHQVEQIRINALQAQIQPHFLYNTLECIHWQAIADGNQQVSTLVKALAKYYRICLSKGKDVIWLEQELEHAQTYLIIQNMRYGDIISTEIDVDPQYYDIQIPKLTLQPLIENSIYHGIRVKEGQTGKIHIHARSEGEDFYILVEDSGTGMSQEQVDEMNASISTHDENFGYGVRNVNKRIEILFGKEYGLTYLKNPSGGITVEIHLPLNADIEYEELL